MKRAKGKEVARDVATPADAGTVVVEISVSTQKGRLEEHNQEQVEVELVDKGTTSPPT